MLSIQINNEFLELPPDIALELVEPNPFLQFAEDEVTGNYSLPADIENTPINNRLTNFAGALQKIIGFDGIEARVYAKGLQHSKGVLKIEKPSYNLNKHEAGRISLYYLFGSSSFFQSIKDKKLREINVGGDRSFPWAGYIYTPGGSDFASHITDVVNGTAGYGTSGYDYAFYPVINRTWPGALLEPDIMNYVFYDGYVKFGTDQTPYNGRNPNRMIPFPYLKYILLKAFEFVGWKITGDVLDDVDFKKITMINFRTIFWAYARKSSGSHQLIPNDVISFNLKDHLPDIDISSFLLAIKNRMGWWFDYDLKTKTVTVRLLNDCAIGEAKEMTQYASPLLDKSITQEKKIYALKNNFATDLGGGQPDFNIIKLEGSVNAVADLPSAIEALYGHAYLVIAENNFYICEQNETTEAYEWKFFTYNIYDYLPAGYTV